MSYYDIILQYDWETTRRKIYASTEADVERALSHDRPSMDDFAALVSPAADKYLGEMASKSYATRSTSRIFARTTASTAVSTARTRSTARSSRRTKSTPNARPSKKIRSNTSCW